jgi:hypothetical protein
VLAGEARRGILARVHVHVRARVRVRVHGYESASKHHFLLTAGAHDEYGNEAAVRARPVMGVLAGAHMSVHGDVRVLVHVGTHMLDVCVGGDDVDHEVHVCAYALDLDLDPALAQTLHSCSRQPFAAVTEVVSVPASAVVSVPASAVSSVPASAVVSASAVSESAVVSASVTVSPLEARTTQTPCEQKRQMNLQPLERRDFAHARSHQAPLQMSYVVSGSMS